jgi:hypothetical protein
MGAAVTALSAYAHLDADRGHDQQMALDEVGEDRTGVVRIGPRPPRPAADPAERRPVHPWRTREPGGVIFKRVFARWAGRVATRTAHPDHR